MLLIAFVKIVESSLECLKAKKNKNFCFWYANRFRVLSTMTIIAALCSILFKIDVFILQLNRRQLFDNKKMLLKFFNEIKQFCAQTKKKHR
jgi:hypothetical protein